MAFFKNIKSEENSAIVSISIDRNCNYSVEIFNLKGMNVTDKIESLPSGLYILKSSIGDRKIIVK